MRPLTTIAGCALSLALSAAAFTPLPAHAQVDPAGKVWVSLTVNSVKGTTYEYNGELERTAFEALTAGTQTAGFVKLTSCWWIDAEGNVVHLSDQQWSGLSACYTDTMFVRAQDICKIILSDVDQVAKNVRTAGRK